MYYSLQKKDRVPGPCCNIRFRIVILLVGTVGIKVFLKVIATMVAFTFLRRIFRDAWKTLLGSIIVMDTVDFFISPRSRDSILMPYGKGEIDCLNRLTVIQIQSAVQWHFFRFFLSCFIRHAGKFSANCTVPYFSLIFASSLLLNLF